MIKNMRRKRITITIREDVLRKIDTIIDGKNIRNRSNAIETVLAEKFKNNIIQKAVILGGRRLTKIGNKNVPELLIPVHGRPLLEHQIEKFKSIGVNELIISTGKYKQQIKDIFGNGDSFGLHIRYIDSEGSAGILNKIKDDVKGGFLVINGDIYIEDIDFEDMYNFHRLNKGQATILVATVENSTPLGSIFMKGNQIIDFKEKMKIQSYGAHLVNAGVYIIEQSVCKMKLPKHPMFEHDVFTELAKQKKLIGYQSSTPWIHLHSEKHLRFYEKRKLI